MIRNILIIGFLQFTVLFQAQEIKLSECFEAVEKNYPLIDQLTLQNEINSLSKSVLETQWLPQISLNGQFSYQSDVTQLNVPISGVTPISPNKEQYRATFDITQTIYDGGITGLSKDLQDLSTELQNNKSKIEIRNALKITQQYFFKALLAQENILIWETNINEINERKKILESGVKNGTVKQSEVDILKVELLKTEQIIVEIQTNKKTAIKVISLFTGADINENVTFKIPNEYIALNDDFNSKPEIQSLELQAKVADKELKIKNSELLPKIGLLGQGGIGNPGLNQLNTEFDTFYMVGARLKWDFSSLYNQHKNSKIKEYTLENIQTQKSTLIINLNAQKKAFEEEIKKLERLILKDEEIVALRQNISKVASVELDNGIINATNYLIEKNAEKITMQSLVMHQIQKIATQHELKLLNEY